MKKPAKHSSTWHTYFWAGFAVLMFILDIASKWIVQSLCTPGKAYQIIPNFIYVTLSYNTKIAFSLGIDGVWGRVLNIAISLIMSALLILYYVLKRKELKPVMKAALSLLIAGAVGNLIDRAFYWEGTTGFNGVIDFIQFYLGGGPNAATSVVNPFATFNWADSCLTIGVIIFIIILIVDSITHDDKETLPEAKTTEKTSTLEENPTRENGVKSLDKPLNEDPKDGTSSK